MMDMPAQLHITRQSIFTIIMNNNIPVHNPTQEYVNCMFAWSCKKSPKTQLYESSYLDIMEYFIKTYHNNLLAGDDIINALTAKKIPASREK